MEIKEIEEIAARTIEDLPEYFKNKLNNLIVIVKERPGSEIRKRFGNNLLGLYEGVPLSQRGTAYSGAMPDKITLFKKNIEKSCLSDEETARQVRHVVIHEIAHHFGISDEELIEKGIY